jgi:hypothetical protein
VGDLTKQECAAVAQARGVPAELVPGIGLRYRGGSIGDQVTGQQLQSLGTAQGGGVETKLSGQRLVEHEESRVRGFLCLPWQGHFREFPGEATVQGDD